jgi:hypothetical protein
VPIIASDVDGIPDIVTHEQTGLLVPVTTVGPWPPPSRGCTPTLPCVGGWSEGRTQRLAAFRPEVMAACYMDLYREILSA